MLIKVWWMDRRLHLEGKETKNQGSTQETLLLSWMRKNMMFTSEYFTFAVMHSRRKNGNVVQGARTDILLLIHRVIY
jgi:hypothetical protein